MTDRVTFVPAMKKRIETEREENVCVCSLRKKEGEKRLKKTFMPTMKIVNKRVREENKYCCDLRKTQKERKRERKKDRVTMSYCTCYGNSKYREREREEVIAA